MVQNLMKQKTVIISDWVVSIEPFLTIEEYKNISAFFNVTLISGLHNAILHNEHSDWNERFEVSLDQNRNFFIVVAPALEALGYKVLDSRKSK